MFLEGQGDPFGAMTSGVGVGTNTISFPMTGMIVILTATIPSANFASSTPHPKKHMPESRHYVVDVEHDATTDFEESFLGASCVSSRGKRKH